MLHSPTKRRRIVNSLILVVSLLIATLVLQVSKISLANAAELSGWLVLVSCAILLIYAVRKRMSTMPLGRVAHWLQLHIYLGIFCLIIFLQHIDWQLPNGWFEIALAVSFVGTILTGLLGLYWSRTLPSQLTRLGDEVMYERINAFATKLRDEAEQEVLQAVEASGSSALADFHKRTGHGFFAKPRFQWQRLVRNYMPEQRILGALRLARRFMKADEMPHAERMEELIAQKNRLDAHFTWQGTLKHWLFIHLAFSLALVPLVVLHVITAYNFVL